MKAFVFSRLFISTERSPAVRLQLVRVRVRVRVGVRVRVRVGVRVRVRGLGLGLDPHLLGFLVDSLVDALLRLLPTAALAWLGFRVKVRSGSRWGLGSGSGGSQLQPSPGTA